MPNTSLKVMGNILSVLGKELNSLSPEEIECVEKGSFQIKLIIENQTRKKNEAEPRQIDFLELLEKLNTVEKREDALSVIDESCKTKKEIEKLARSLDVAVLRSDRAEKIKFNIVESTVGARIRSRAIQGKKI